PAEQFLYHRVVVAGGGAGEQVVGQAQAGEVLDDLPVVPVGELLDGDALLFRLDEQRGAVLVGAGDHQDLVAGHALVAGEDVGGDAESGDVTDVAGSVGVRPGDGGEDARHAVQVKPWAGPVRAVCAATIGGVNPTPAQLVAHLVAVGHRPAALVGDWFGYAAVVAPDLVARPTPLADAFPAGASAENPAALRAGNPVAAQAGPWHFGWIPYSAPEVGPAAFAASTRDVVVFDGGSWSIPDGSGIDPDWFRSVLSDAARAALPHDPAIGWDGGDRGAHERGVLDCLDAIRAGDIYQACLSTRFHGRVAGSRSPLGVTGFPSPLGVAAAWWALRVGKHNPARAAFICGVTETADDDGAAGTGESAAPRGIVLASLSPEEFLVRDGSTVRESPIKGTIPLTSDPAELAASAKDVAENIMIVDLVRH